MRNNNFIWDEYENNNQQPGPKTKKDAKQKQKKRDTDNKINNKNKKQVNKSKKKNTAKKKPTKQKKVQHKKQKPKKVNYKKNTKKRRKKRFIMLFLLFIMFLIFAPIYKVNDIAMNATYLVDEADVVSASGIKEGEYYSFWTIHNINIESNKETDDLVSELNASYSIKTKTLTIDIKEIKPLAVDSSGTLYYGDGDEVKKSTEMTYVAPMLIGFSKDMQEDLLAALNTLDYVIIKEIVAIEYVEDEVLPDLVKMQMADDNVVYVTISEISNKMPYYLQMTQVIEQEADGKPGTIHLERGNYYEPF